MCDVEGMKVCKNFYGGGQYAVYSIRVQRSIGIGDDLLQRGFFVVGQNSPAQILAGDLVEYLGKGRVMHSFSNVCLSSEGLYVPWVGGKFWV